VNNGKKKNWRGFLRNYRILRKDFARWRWEAVALLKLFHH
jgi:hypothetical protein